MLEAAASVRKRRVVGSKEDGYRCRRGSALGAHPLHCPLHDLEHPSRVVAAVPSQHHVRLIHHRKPPIGQSGQKDQIASDERNDRNKMSALLTQRAKWSARAAPQPPSLKDDSVMESPNSTIFGRISHPRWLVPDLLERRRREQSPPLIENPKPKQRKR